MFCGNCGVENTNDAKFCKGCGKTLGNTQKLKKIEPMSQNRAQTGKADAAVLKTMVEKTKMLPKNIIIAICAVIALTVTLIVFICRGSSTINLDKYLTIEVNGYDGYGSARAKIDWQAIEKKYGSKIEFTSDAKKMYGGIINYMTPVEAIEESVRVAVDPYKKLSNNDEIAYTWHVNDDLTELVKCKVKTKNGTYKVSGLKEIGTFDAFANLSVEFSGIAPRGKANLNYTGSEMKYYDFNFDNVSGLKNGDKVKVTIKEDCVDYYAESIGMIPETLEKEFVVEGLDKYIESFDDINEESLKSMKKQAEDVYHADVAKNWGESEELLDLTYLGEYLLTAKNPNENRNENILYLVYKAQVRDTYSNGEQSYDKINDVYWYTSYSDLTASEKTGVNVDLKNYKVPGNRFTIDTGISKGWWSTQSWYYYGYQTFEELYKNVVTKNMEAYNHQDNIENQEAITDSTAETEM